MSLPWQPFSSREQMDPGVDHNGFEGSGRRVWTADKSQGLCCKLESGWCSFASRTRRMKHWKWCLAGSAGHGARCSAGCSPKGCSGEIAAVSGVVAAPCSELLRARCVTPHLALLYKSVFVAVRQRERKGFLSSGLALQTVLVPLLLFWWAM